MWLRKVNTILRNEYPVNLTCVPNRVECQYGFGHLPDLQETNETNTLVNKTPISLDQTKTDYPIHNPNLWKEGVGNPGSYKCI